MNSIIKQISDLIGINPIIVISMIILIYIIKWSLEIKENKYKIRSEQLDKLFKFYQDENLTKDRFLYEEIITYRFGTYIPYDVISILMKLKNPTYALKNYAKGQNLLELTNNSTSIKYKHSIAHYYVFTIIHFFLYVFGIFASYYTLVGSIPNIDYTNNDYIAKLLMNIIFLCTTSLLVYLSLDKAYEYRSAMNVVKLLKKNQLL